MNYISLQGKVYLAEIVAGVAGVPRHIGNCPDFEIETSADVINHMESTTGNRTMDFSMTKTSSVKFSGTLEEITPDNLAYLLDGASTAVTGGTVVAKSLGTVVADQEISLGGYNITALVIKDSTGTPITVNPSKYKLDASFGAVTFNDVTGLVMPLVADFTAGVATSVTINDSAVKEYELMFRGINTTNGDKAEVMLWRTKKDPGTKFPLIHKDLGSYQIKGSALSDTTKDIDGTFGLYGRYVTISPAA